MFVGGYTVFTLSICLSDCPCVRLCVRLQCWFFPNILKTQRWIFINFCRHIDIKEVYLIRECKGWGPILLGLLPFVKFFLNAVKSLCAHYLFNQWLDLKTSLVKCLCAHYLFNQWLEFDQISTDTSSGWGKEVIWFWWSWPYFQDHYIINTQ